MSIGDAWAGMMGSMDKDSAFNLLDAFYESGGNFIDTASSYQNEQSEQWIGEWIQARNNRDSLVLATKFSMDYRSHVIGKGPQAANFAGNSCRAIHVGIRDSLKKLRTDYIGELVSPLGLLWEVLLILFFVRYILRPLLGLYYINQGTHGCYTFSRRAGQGSLSRSI
jgi:hypothetical protein